jgi:uncharacterized protein YegP (UPF0339 family)
MTTIKIFKDRFGRFRFFLKHNNQIIFFSEPFISKRVCLLKVDFFRTNSRKDKNYKRLKAECGSYYFQYRNHANGEIIGTSESYIEASTMEHAITLLRMSSHCTIEIDEDLYVA